MPPAVSSSTGCRCEPTSPPAPSTEFPARPNSERGQDERDLRGAAADRSGLDARSRGGLRGDQRRRAPGREHPGLEEQQGEDAAGRHRPARRRHPLRGAGDERPPRPGAGPRVLHQRTHARAEGDHRRRRHVGGAARRRRRPLRPTGDRRTDPGQEPRRPRRVALGGADAPGDPCRLRCDRRRQERRHPRRPAHQLLLITRYTRPEMGEVWSQQRKLEWWLEVELAAPEAWAEEGAVPREAAEAARANAAFTVEAVNEREKVTDHDVAAFVDVVAQSVGEHGRWIHYGLTSSDVLDTALALQLGQAGEVVLTSARASRDALIERALQPRDTLSVGPPPGVHAEPTTFGLRLAGFAFEADRTPARLSDAFEQLRFGKLSGAVGTYASVPPAIEARVMERLGLKREDVATQVVPRDRHAQLLTAVAIAGAGLERFATEVRNLQKTE